MNERDHIRGVSLVEACTVLAVIAVLAASAAPSFKQARTRKAVEGAAAELAAQLHLARNEAQALATPVRLSLYATPSGTCALVHTGPATACSCGVGTAATCSGEAQALHAMTLNANTGVRLQANVSSMLFDPLHGTTSPAGTWRAVSSAAGSINHVVNILGRVRTCSPEPALAGYRAC